MTAPTIIDFMSDPSLLGPFFAGPTWDRWRAVLKAAEALPMTAAEIDLFREVAERDPPARPVKEIVIIAGRGGGKDAITSAHAAHKAVTGDFSRLRPGERGTVMCFATDRDQARIQFSYIRGYFEQVPLLAALVQRTTDDSILLKNGAEILVCTNSLRAPRGRAICEANYGEVAFWRSEESAHPDVEVDTAVTPGLLRFPGSTKIMISSAYRRSGLLYDRWREFYGKNDPDVLVVLGTARQFNETLDETAIDRELQRDYERAAAEYLSIWRSDLADFIDRALIEDAVDCGVVIRTRQPGVRYVCGLDPSGGRGDSFTAAIAHAEKNDRIVLDFLFEKRAPFDAAATVAEVASAMHTYGVSEGHGDDYGAEWVVGAFQREHIAYKKTEFDRSRLYLNALPLFTTGRVRLLDNPRLIHQFTSLERRTSRSGHDSVNHPQRGGFHDDLANACAIALGLAATGAAGIVITDQMLATWSAASLALGNGRGGLADPYRVSPFGNPFNPWSQ